MRYSPANVFRSYCEIERKVMIRRLSGLLMLLIVGASIPLSLYADTKTAIRNTLSKPVIRGGIVFKHYCVLCHGEQGNGQSRANRLYKNTNLKINPDNKSQFEIIIRAGGEAVGKSPFMPPWQKELSNEQIQDVVAYLKVLSDEIKRGEVVFKSNCILCHGIKGDGKGRVAKLYDPPPADLTKSEKNDDYKENIIRLGGKAMGRSDIMPPWEGQLTDQEIKDLVKYISSLNSRR